MSDGKSLSSCGTVDSLQVELHYIWPVGMEVSMQLRASWATWPPLYCSIIKVPARCIVLERDIDLCHRRMDIDASCCLLRSHTHHQTSSQQACRTSRASDERQVRLARGTTVHSKTILFMLADNQHHFCSLRHPALSMLFSVSFHYMQMWHVPISWDTQ